MQLLVLGAGGLLGSNVVVEAVAGGADVVATYRSTEPPFEVPCRRLEIRDAPEFEDLLDEYSPDAVVNCAAMTDVDACESRPEVAREVNATAPGALASTCAARSVDFVHFSTDYVFDGTRRSPYPETAAPDPVQTYGSSKLAGERAVREEHGAPLVVRLSFVYGMHRATESLEGFPAWLRGRLVDGVTTELFTDQWVTPSRADESAETVLALIEAGTSGTFHVACRSCVTPHEFGELIRERMGRSESLVQESTRDSMERPATRPAYTCLDATKVAETLGRTRPSLAEDLDALGPEFDG